MVFRKIWALLVLNCAVAGTAKAQSPILSPPTGSEVVREQYRVAEVAGLRRWTAAMVQDSIDRYVPGMSLFSHACAATLRNELGFPEAASFRMNSPGGRRGFVNVVLLIEPQDSALVRHRDLPRDLKGTAAPWPDLVSWQEEQREAVWYAVRSRILAGGRGSTAVIPAGAGEHEAAIRTIWAYLDDRIGVEHADEARQILRTSPFLYDRMAAVAILSSFPDDHRSWYELAGGLLEADGPVRSFAGMVLRTFAEFEPYVDWRPAASEVHAILNGSNLFELTSFMNVLLKTGADTGLAELVLRNGGHGVLLQALLEFPEMRDPAIDLLRALSGRDFGTNVDAWRLWVAGL